MLINILNVCSKIKTNFAKTSTVSCSFVHTKNRFRYQNCPHIVRTRIRSKTFLFRRKKNWTVYAQKRPVIRKLFVCIATCTRAGFAAKKGWFFEKSKWLAKSMVRITTCIREKSRVSCLSTLSVDERTIFLRL